MCEMKQEGQFSKNTQIITVCYSTCVRIEMKQEGQFSKKQQKHQFITVCYSTRGAVFQKHTNYYCMLFNLCAYWNETRGTVFKKTTKTPIYYSMLFNKRGSFPKTHNLLLYAIQLVCVLKWNKWDSFQKKNTNLLVCYSTCVHIWNETRGAVFKKFQLMKICYWTCVRNETRGAVCKKTTKTPIYYSMLFNKRGSFPKTHNLLLYAIQLVCVLKWNKRDKKIQLMTICHWTRVRNETRGAVFQKHTIYYSMLFNLCTYWNETKMDRFQ